MNKYLNKSTVATTLSTLVIAGVTYIDEENLTAPVRDAIRMFTPILSHVIIVVAMWIFIKSGFDTIEGMRETKIREKRRKEIQQDIHILSQAIKSNLLTDKDKISKQAELSAKLTELTNMKVKVKDS
ncbi:hypothetical protein [Marinomonas transparens]|uniref:Uncharacterized protein n=1 Tax=Marinomonas transparens TaxID=2795388 RepID=A0A934MXZ8_9GAMM|nr:hypothetical protein [Marinomonas transparens]MBJ7539859.1 hypothetical protein [Marinomonas transparens]